MAALPHDAVQLVDRETNLVVPWPTFLAHELTSLEAAAAADTVPPSLSDSSALAVGSCGAGVASSSGGACSTDDFSLSMSTELAALQTSTAVELSAAIAAVGSDDAEELGIAAAAVTSQPPQPQVSVCRERDLLGLGERPTPCDAPSRRLSRSLVR